MTDASVRVATIAAVAAIVIAMIFFLGLYTKAQNDQAYLQIVGENMSEEGFDKFMENKQHHDGNAW